MTKNTEKLTDLLPKKKLIKIVKASVDFYFQGYESDLYRYLTDVRKFFRLEVLMALGFYSALFFELYSDVTRHEEIDFYSVKEACESLHLRKVELSRKYAGKAESEWDIQKDVENDDDL